MRNLYFQSRRFRDFNFTDCLDRIDTVSERGLNWDIRKAYDSCEPPDPCFVDTVTLSLRMETAAKFLEHVHVSLEPRDFLLSKLFQFLYQPLTIQNQLDEPGALPLRRHLELWLDGLPETALARLYRFDWLQFFADSNRLSRPTLLGRLDRYLPTLRRKQPRAAWMGRRGPVPDIAAYTAIGKAVRRVGKGWTRQPGLRQVCQLLDDVNCPTPASWAKLDPPATSWRSAVESDSRRVRNTLKYRFDRLQELSGRAKSIREQSSEADKDERG